MYEGTACAKLIYAGDQRVALVQGGSGATRYFHGDHLGSTSVLTDSNGTEEEHNSYRPYGDIATHTGPSNVAYKDTEQERDASTGWYFYQVWRYDLLLGRFVSADTIVPNFLDSQVFDRFFPAHGSSVSWDDLCCERGPRHPPIRIGMGCCYTDRWNLPK